MATTKQTKKRVKEPPESEIISLWGTGTGATTMVLHVKKKMYEKLKWELGSLVMVTPDYEKGTLTIKPLKS